MVDGELVESNRKDKLFWFKVISGAILLVALLVLIGIKIANKDFSLKYPLIILGILIFLWLLQFFAKRIVELIRKQQEPQEIPEPISKDEVIKLVYETIHGKIEHDYKDGIFRNIK